MKTFLPSWFLYYILLVGAAFVLLTSSYQQDLAVRVLLAGIVAVGLRPLVGLAGLISIGHAGFLAIGAYVSAILTSRAGWSSLAAMAAAVVISWGMAMALGWVVLRLRGLYLAMATLGFNSIVFIAVNTELNLTGGPDGMQVPPLSVLGYEISGRTEWYLIAATLLLLLLAGTASLQRSQFGHSLQAIRTSESATSSSGVNVAGTKIKVFAFSAVIASLGGSLLAHYSGYITPQIASFIVSVEFLSMVIIGGPLSVLGPLIGAAIITTLPIALGSAHEGVEMICFGLVLMGVIALMPRGIEAHLREWMPRRKGR